MTNPTCDYCDKRGVPILPLRYGLAPSGTAPTPATGPAVALPASAAHYTRRLLRSGYLYVYDEARSRWDDYFVTADGYFFRICNTPGIPPVLPQKPFDCPDMGHAAVASCITIPDAKRATKIWLGFSDVQWTPTVRDRHAQPGYRQLHMRCVTINSFASSPDKQHCLSIKQVGTQVAEYAMPPRALNAALDFSPFAANSRSGRAERLVEECERLAPGKGFAIVMEDPTGIAAELDALMTRNLRLFTTKPAWERELVVSSAIIQIEAVVREQAIQAEIAAAEDLASQQLTGNPLGHVLSESTRQRTEALRTVTPAEERRAADQAWKRYAEKFDVPRARAWRAAFDSQLKDYDAKFIAPLAQAHAKWMTSVRMADGFGCNFDDADADSGIVYARTLAMCIGESQDKAACFDLYADWLDGDVTQKANLLLRALVLNLQATADDIANATRTNLDWRDFPLDGLVGNFGKATERVAAGAPDVLGRLVSGIAGPLAQWLGRAVDGKVRAGMVALGLHTQQPFVVVEVVGGKKKFREKLIRELIRASGQPVPEKQMQQAIKAQMRRLELAGVPLQGSQRKRFVLVVDPAAARNMPAGLNAQGRAKWLSSNVTTVEQMEALNLGRWRDQVRNPMLNATKGSIPYVAGVLGAVLQYNAMQKLSEDDANAMTHEAQEATWRLRAGIAALGGTIAELAGQGIEKLGTSSLKFGRQFGAISPVLKIVGKVVGIAGALIMAWWDLEKADEASGEGQHGLKWAYRASAGLGFLAAMAILLSWTGVGLILVTLLIAVTVLIEYFKDNKVQDWLERCVWGNGPATRYDTPLQERQQLKRALAG